MPNLEILLGIGYAILVGNLLARRTRVASPIVLIALGVVLTFLPVLRDVSMPAEVVLMVFLPVLLYWEALTTSLQEIRASLRGIILTSTVLVVFTAACVAVVAHWCGLAWGTAWIIGAAVAPTDATAVAALGRGLPRNTMTVLKAESLINDGTALVVSALAIEVASGEGTVTGGHAAEMFGISFVGGALVGLLTGWVIARLGRYVTHIPLLANVMMLLTPLTAFFLAELVEASGVLAVVVCGLYMAQVGPKFISVGSRVLATPFWSVATFMLNGSLFVLVGLQIPRSVQGLSSGTLGNALVAIVAIFLALLVARFVFLHVSIGLIRLLDRRPSQRARRTTFRGRMVSVFAGFRGAVSLAVALSVPTVLGDGEPFPGRDMIIFVTAGVVLMTLVVQGTVFPTVIRWASPSGPAEPPSDQNEATRALWEATVRVQKELPRMAAEHQVADEVLRGLEKEYEDQLRLWEDAEDTAEADARAEHRRQDVDLRLAAIHRKRHVIIGMRDDREIDDTVMRELLQRLDVEELRLTGPVETE